uniref:Uncharacterized protein n=1 Tax=Avena sativa TaxID=4498 RepID=A0ACD5TRD0_AVESA
MAVAVWTGLGQVATVAQLVGADVGGLISMIMQSVLTARQNRKECEQLARRVLMVAQLLPHVQEDPPEAVQQLAGLGDALRDAHELVVSCQGRSAAYQFVMAGRQAERFREVQSKIDFYLILFPVISHIGITRRLERIHNILVQDDSTRAGLSQLPQSSQLLQESTEVVPRRTQLEFTFEELMAATNNFSLDTVIGEGGFGTVYRGRLHDGREVAVKRMKTLESRILHSSIFPEDYHSGTYPQDFRSSDLQEEFRTEIHILPRLRHKHIIRLLGSCVTVSKEAATPRRKKGLLTRRRKEPEEPAERLIIYDYMHNGTLFDHLHLDHGSSSSPVALSWKKRVEVLLSPVTLSWKKRVEVLLAVSRAIEHLHCHANPPIIHRDTKSANILFDANWVPHVSDFGSSVAWDMASSDREEPWLEVSEIVGTIGYLAPEYMARGRLSPRIDVYSLGVVMLEVLTGKMVGEIFGDLPILDSRPVPIVPDFLDRRPVPEPTPWQMQALKCVAWTARGCVKLDDKDRLPIADVVANLERAHQLICRDQEPVSVDEVDELVLVSGSPVSSTGYGYWSDMESEVLEQGR